jgi:hypothetical protein
MLYKAECWPIKKQHIQQIRVDEMCMLRWMCGYTKIDWISNEVL